jgi:hypothetical protein
VSLRCYGGSSTLSSKESGMMERLNSRRIHVESIRAIRNFGLRRPSVHLSRRVSRLRRTATRNGRRCCLAQPGFSSFIDRFHFGIRFYLSLTTLTGYMFRFILNSWFDSSFSNIDRLSKSRVIAGTLAPLGVVIMIVAFVLHELSHAT